MFEALPQRHSRIILRTADGKAEPFRKECGEAANTARCGGAARKTLLKKQELSFVSSAQSVDALRLPISSDPRYS